MSTPAIRPRNASDAISQPAILPSLWRSQNRKTSFSPMKRGISPASPREAIWLRSCDVRTNCEGISFARAVDFFRLGAGLAASSPRAAPAAAPPEAAAFGGAAPAKLLSFKRL